eukprot:1108814-Prymnesium_polylepis.1
MACGVRGAVETIHERVTPGGTVPYVRSRGAGGAGACGLWPSSLVSRVRLRRASCGLSCWSVKPYRAQDWG